MGMRVKAVWRPRDEWGTTPRTSATSSRPASPTPTTSPTSSTSERSTTMRDVAVVGFAQRQMQEFDGSPTGVEMLVPIFAGAARADRAGPRTTSTSGARARATTWPGGRSRSSRRSTRSARCPPVIESHVEMDAAWALYEAWVKIQTGEVDTALVYGFGKSSAGDSAPDAGAAARPVHGDAALAGRGVDRRRCRRGSASSAGCGTRRRWPRSSARSMTDAAGNEWRDPQGRDDGRRPARPAAVRRPAAPLGLRADQRRRRRDGARRRRRGRDRRAQRHRGLDHRLRAPHRPDRARRARPDALAERPRRPARPPGSTASTSPSCTRRSPTRS